MKESKRMSLSQKLVDFYESYDFYDFRDSLEVGETKEDAVKKMEEELCLPNAISSIVQMLLSFEQSQERDELILDCIRHLETNKIPVSKASLNSDTNKKKLEDIILSADISLFHDDTPYYKRYAEYLEKENTVVFPIKPGDNVFELNKGVIGIRTVKDVVWTGGSDFLIRLKPYESYYYKLGRDVFVSYADAVEYKNKQNNTGG